MMNKNSLISLELAIRTKTQIFCLQFMTPLTVFYKHQFKMILLGMFWSKIPKMISEFLKTYFMSWKEFCKILFLNFERLKVKSNFAKKSRYCNQLYILLTPMIFQMWLKIKKYLKRCLMRPQVSKNSFFENVLRKRYYQAQ